jgi:hypothetical protein
MVSDAPLRINQEEVVGASEEKALAIRHDSSGVSGGFELVYPGGRYKGERRKVRRGASRTVVSRNDRPLMSHHAGVTGVYTDNETAYKTLACALIHQAYLDATNKRPYQRPNRENDRQEHERSARYFFESRAYNILCEILNLDPKTITKKIDETN